MLFHAPLTHGTLIRRYKRFLADAELDGIGPATIHCPNPGAMIGLDMPGLEIWAKRGSGKLGWGWELARLPDEGLVGINTTHPNRIVERALARGAIPELAGYGSLRREVRYGTNSRVDFLLEAPAPDGVAPDGVAPDGAAGRPPCWLEVKNVHLVRRRGLAEFPDCVTARGTRHLGDLMTQVALGHRAVMLYLVQRMGCTHFDVARDIDPAYGRAFDAARSAGVEMICYACDVSLEGIALTVPLEVL